MLLVMSIDVIIIKRYMMLLSLNDNCFSVDVITTKQEGIN